ncbi:MAG: hypothetical protein LBD23_10950 [Oscillospiraceae bacterium]|nr:hypothetical protein [Oscillospiraceae bacterium]
MAIVNELKCARCDRKYSGVRSRCPYCGARRIGRGKYSEDSDNAKGKMLISVLIMSVFTVAAGILLFTTPVDADAPDPDNNPSLNSPEDDINSEQGIPPELTPTPTLDPVPTDSPLPIEVTSIQIWVPNSHRVTDFTMPKGSSIELTARLEPPGIENSVSIIWESTDEEVFEFANVVGGIKIVALETGDARLIARVGDLEEECWVRVRN